MSKLVKTRGNKDHSYFVEIESRNYERSPYFDGYRTSNPETDEFTQILSFIVDHEWETASTSETCFMLLREEIKDLLDDDFKDTKSFRENLDSLTGDICLLTKDSIIGIEISDKNGFYKLEVSEDEILNIFKSWQ